MIRNIGLVGLTLVGAVAVTSAAAPVRSGLTLVGFRSWTAPANTRVVFDFSAAASIVAPDSGSGRELMIALPGEPLRLAADVPNVLRIHDGIVDSVTIESAGDGARFHAVFQDSVAFHVFSLTGEADKPHRVVLDVTRPAAVVDEEKRLAGIASAKRRDRVRVIAVDAGHGGEDLGAKGPHHVIEKNVTLAVARDLVQELNKIPGIRGQLVREGDYFIPLRERYHIAERMNADLFVSIHANSSRHRGSGSGSEVYFLSLRGASSQADQDLAETENAADLIGGVPSQAEDDLVNILYDVKRSSALQQSQLLAETLLAHVAEDRVLEARGVKQASFVVLKSVEFPSVLVETAFINNPVEARLLADPDFQHQLGRQLATGVKEYFQRAGVTLGTTQSSGSGAHD